MRSATCAAAHDWAACAPGQELQAALLSQPCQRCGGFRDRHVEGADQHRDAAHESHHLRVNDGVREQLPRALDNQRTPGDGGGVTEDGEQPGIHGVQAQALGYSDDPVPGRHAGLGPKAAQCGAPQDPRSQVGIPVGGNGFREIRSTFPAFSITSMS